MVRKKKIAVDSVKNGFNNVQRINSSIYKNLDAPPVRYERGERKLNTKRSANVREIDEPMLGKRLKKVRDSLNQIDFL